MDAYRLNLKLYFNTADSPDLTPFIPIFHRWIREKSLDELLIDVADYSQVPAGPGVMLIGHEGHYSLDATDGQLGLLYARKRPQIGTFGGRLRSAWRKLLTAGHALEQETGLEIPTDRLALRIQDRLLAPNTQATYDAVEPELRQLLRDAYGSVDIELQPEDDHQACFGIRAKAPVGPPIADLLTASLGSEEAPPASPATWQRGQVAGRQIFGRPQQVNKADTANVVSVS